MAMFLMKMRLTTREDGPFRVKFVVVVVPDDFQFGHCCCGLGSVVVQDHLVGVVVKARLERQAWVRFPLSVWIVFHVESYQRFGIGNPVATLLGA